MADGSAPLLQHGNRNENYSTMDTAALLESGEEENLNLCHRYRKHSLYLIYASSFVGSFSFALYLTSIWPYLEELDCSADVKFLGWIVMAYSLAQMIFSPLIGVWANKISNVKKPIIITLLFSAIGHALYAELEAIPCSSMFHRKWAMMIARLIIGIGGGGSTLYRAYVAQATKVSERTNALAIVSSCQALGTILGPALQAGLTVLGQRGYSAPEMGIYLDMYSVPGWIAFMLSMANAGLLYAWFKEFNITEDIQAETAPSCRTLALVVPSLQISQENANINYQEVANNQENVENANNQEISNNTRNEDDTNNRDDLNDFLTNSQDRLNFRNMTLNSFNNSQERLNNANSRPQSSLSFHIQERLNNRNLSQSSLSLNSSQDRLNNRNLSRNSFVNSNERSTNTLNNENQERSNRESTTNSEALPTPQIQEPPVTNCENDYIILTHGLCERRVSDCDVGRHVDKIAVATCVLVHFIAILLTNTADTVATPLTMDLYMRSQKNAIQVVGIVLATGAVINFTGTLLVGPLSKRFKERKLLISLGCFPMTLAFLLALPAIHGTESIAIPTLLTSTTDSLNYTSQNKYEYLPVSFTAVPHSLQMILAYFLLNIGYAIMGPLSFSLYSKVLGPQKQGFAMGMMTAAASLSRTCAPLVVGQLYTRFGHKVLFGFLGAISLTTMILIMVLSHRLVPWQRRDCSDIIITSENFAPAPPISTANNNT